jgi:predicted GIY-YIG superfamily endonuclease
MNTTHIYILRLKGNRFYIGKSENVLRRYKEHCNGEGSVWTRKYEPLELVLVIEDASPFDEDKYVKEYMSKYGIQNVRGGSYSSEVLDEAQLYTLQREIWGAKDRCMTCGRTGHFGKECFAKTDIYGNAIGDYSCELCNTVFTTAFECAQHEKKCKVGSTCFRCGRQGHFASACYARRHMDGSVLGDLKGDTKK